MAQRTSYVFIVLGITGCVGTARAAAAEPGRSQLPHRWVYVQTNLLVDANVERNLKLFERAAKAGYNGIVLTDSKFMRWDILPERYQENVRRTREACRRLKLDLVACVCPIGYSNDLLSRDPNLAEGLPAIKVPFVAQGRKLVPADGPARIVNGSFEQHKRNMPAGWGFVDQPGEVSFIDTEVTYDGKCSLRMEDISVNNAKYGNGRASQAVVVEPYHYYRVSAAVKTREFETPGNVRIAVLAPDGTSLNHYQPRIERTQDWKRIDVTFNSLACKKVNVYFGVWGGKRGKIWWDDCRIEPAGLVNVVRREGAPLRATSEDGATEFVEGDDFARVEDPKLGAEPYAGEYSVWHEPPVVTIPEKSRIRDGQKVLLSYYHTAIIYSGQVMCCMAEPKLYEILQWQVAQVHKNLQPDAYFLSHDEIRVQGWDASCRSSGKTPAELLADNVGRCIRIVRREDPEKPIYAWSDMFDPAHNAAKSGKYYLVRGDGPWHGSWEGLDKDVGIVNWNSDPAKRAESLAHFATRGHQQILAGYYDGPVGAITPWLSDARRAGGLAGAMYTTWQSRYDDLEAFAAEANKQR
jgi:hypothetical protein